jgi:hypothetical protein
MENIRDGSLKELECKINDFLNNIPILLKWYIKQSVDNHRIIITIWYESP